jgi:hypothetical protein
VSAVDVALEEGVCDDKGLAFRSPKPLVSISKCVESVARDSKG